MIKFRCVLCGRPIKNFESAMDIDGKLIGSKCALKAKLVIQRKRKPAIAAKPKRISCDSDINQIDLFGDKIGEIPQ